MNDHNHRSCIGFHKMWNVLTCYPIYPICSIWSVWYEAYLIYWHIALKWNPTPQMLSGWTEKDDTHCRFFGRLTFFKFFSTWMTAIIVPSWENWKCFVRNHPICRIWSVWSLPILFIDTLHCSQSLIPLSWHLTGIGWNLQQINWESHLQRAKFNALIISLLSTSAINDNSLAMSWLKQSSTCSSVRS